MYEPVTIAAFAAGALFLLFGSTVASYGVSALGVLVGGSGGYLIGPTAAEQLAISPLLASAGAALAGAMIGFFLSAVFLSMALSAIAFVIGTYLGWTVIAGFVVENSSILMEVGVALLVGLVAVGIAVVSSRAILVLLTSFVGAAVISQSVTPADLEAAAATFDPAPLLFDAGAPIFLGVFVFGLLVQFGLFKLGYVTKLTTALPGIRRPGKRSA